MSITYKNNFFTVTITGSKIVLVNGFNNRYEGRLENGKIIAQTAAGLGYMMKAFDELNIAL